MFASRLRDHDRVAGAPLCGSPRAESASREGSSSNGVANPGLPRSRAPRPLETGSGRRCVRQTTRRRTAAVEADERGRAGDGHRPVAVVTVAQVDGNDSAAVAMRAAAIAVQRASRASTASRPGGNLKSASETVPSAERGFIPHRGRGAVFAAGELRMMASPSGRKTRNRGRMDMREKCREPAHP